MAALGHEPTFGTLRGYVCYAAVTRHSAPKVGYAALTATPYSTKSALGHLNHLKTRLRPLPCPGRALPAIWNYMCGGRHARTVTVSVAARRS